MKFTTFTATAITVLQLTSAQPQGRSDSSERRDLKVKKSGNGSGITWFPYRSGGDCKSLSEVQADFAQISANGYSLVRLYGTDCNQVTFAVAAARASGLKLFAGTNSLMSLGSDLSTIISAANGNWGIFDTISIGNELVRNGDSVADVVSAIHSARGTLRSAGFAGNVVAVDTSAIVQQNPSLCDASDYCAISCQPFYSGIDSSHSGTFVVSQASAIQSVLSDHNKNIVIAETGWPTQGQANGAAVPSFGNQQVALLSLQASFSSKPSSLIFFTAFDDLWRNPGEFGVDQYWGILN